MNLMDVGECDGRTCMLKTRQVKKYQNLTVSFQVMGNILICGLLHPHRALSLR